MTTSIAPQPSPRAPSRLQRISRHLLTGLFAVALFASGAGKLTGAMDAALAGLGVPLWAIPLIGLAELIGAIGFVVPKTRFYGGAVLSFVLLGAVGTHALNADFAGLVAPAILLAAIASLSWIQRPDVVRAHVHRAVHPSPAA